MTISLQTAIDHAFTAQNKMPFLKNTQEWVIHHLQLAECDGRVHGLNHEQKQSRLPGKPILKKERMAMYE